jgi:predicted Na+-dependent transporter
MIVMIIINTVNMGGQLDLQIIRQVFKRPIGPAVGFASQFIIMPLVISLWSLKIALLCIITVL